VPSNLIPIAALTQSIKSSILMLIIQVFRPVDHRAALKIERKTSH